jgi:glycosyltransferase involved in cell wall biosynthesis
VNPLVSIIVPVFNKAPYISQGLGSLLNQTYKNIEIICVDNNSTDDSLSVLKAWEQKHPQVIKIIEERKQGAPCARNAGTTIAMGEWIQYFDVDDFLYPNKIEHQIHLMQKSDKSIDIVFEGWEIVMVSGEERKHVAMDDAWMGVFNGRMGNTNSVLIKKQKIIEVGGWNESRKSSQEGNLFFEILKTNAQYIRSENMGSIFQMRPNSISTSTAGDNKNLNRIIDLRERILQYLIENKTAYFNANKDFFLGMFLERLRWLYRQDVELSSQLYNKYCKGNVIKPIASMSARYMTFLRIFGFPLTEKIFLISAKLKKVTK